MKKASKELKDKFRKAYLAEVADKVSFEEEDEEVIPPLIKGTLAGFLELSDRQQAACKKMRELMELSDRLVEEGQTEEELDHAQEVIDELGKQIALVEELTDQVERYTF